MDSMEVSTIGPEVNLRDDPNFDPDALILIVWLLLNNLLPKS